MNYEKIKGYFLKYRLLALLPITLIVIIIPESPMQKFIRYFPNQSNRAAFSELKHFLKDHPSQKLAVSSNISPLMDRVNYEIFVSDSICKINNNSEYILLYNQTYRNQIYLNKCILELKSSNIWIKLNKYKNISVYKLKS